MKSQSVTFPLLGFTCLLVSLTPFFASPRGQAIDNLQWGPPVDGLQLSLSTIDSGKGGLVVAFRNAGTRDVSLNLGSMLANGKVQLPDRIYLNQTDADGKSRTFKFSDRQHSFIAGRVDYFVVPLRVGSIYTVNLRLDQFWCVETKEFEVRLLPGKNQLTAQFEGSGTQQPNLDMQGIALMSFWLGKVQSNSLLLER